MILHHEKCLTLTFMKVKNKLIHLNCQIKKKTFIYKNKNTRINQLMLNNLIHSFFGGDLI